MLILDLYFPNKNKKNRCQWAIFYHWIVSEKYNVSLDNFANLSNKSLNVWKKIRI